MNGDQTAHTNPSTDQQFYRVEEQGRPPDECQCANCKLWTVVYDDGEPTEIGTAYQGDAGKEAAEDVCDLMNMAYEAGQESHERPERLQRLEQLAKLASELCTSLDRQEEDIGGSRKPLDIIQEMGPLCDKVEGR